MSGEPWGPRVSWTHERIETLKEKFSEGKSAQYIADLLGGVSRNAVIGKWHRMRLPGGKKRLRVGPRPRNRPEKPEFLTANIIERRKRNQAAMGKQPRPIPPEPDSGHRCSIFELNGSTCRWPIGDITERDGFTFCGAPAPEQPYCEFHQNRAYQRGS